MRRTPTEPRRRAVDVRIPIGEIILQGTLTMPSDVCGIVLFAHGSGSSRHSPRNRFVARELELAGIATFLFDLLTEEEEEAEQVTRHLRFDIDLLTERLLGATDWIRRHPPTGDLNVGYFGASTGAAAALRAAVERPLVVQAIVSRGGRPDLAMSVLDRVTAPTLLIVGELDEAVIEMNRQALAELHAEKRLEIVPGATHLFEEAGALEKVADLAGRWFKQHLTPVGSPS